MYGEPVYTQRHIHALYEQTHAFDTVMHANTLAHTRARNPSWTQVGRQPSTLCKALCAGFWLSLNTGSDPLCCLSI